MTYASEVAALQEKAAARIKPIPPDAVALPRPIGPLRWLMPMVAGLFMCVAGATVLLAWWIPSRLVPAAQQLVSAPTTPQLNENELINEVEILLTQQPRRTEEILQQRAIALANRGESRACLDTLTALSLRTPLSQEMRLLRWEQRAKENHGPQVIEEIRESVETWNPTQQRRLMVLIEHLTLGHPVKAPITSASSTFAPHEEDAHHPPVHKAPTSSH